MENTFTPGPWACYHEGTREVNDTFVHTFIVVTPNTVAHDNSIGIATSKLIAAAPDLLEALEDLLQIADNYKVEGPYMKKARAAIHKAKNG